MGSHCSSVKSSSVVQPFRKVNASTIAPFSDKNGAWNESQIENNQTNFESNKSSRGFVAESFLSPEHALGVTIKHKMLAQEAVTEEALRHGSASHLNETNMNMSRTTEAPNVKRLFQYKKGPLIGKGTYGEVYECLNLNTGELLAVKSFKIHGDLNKVLSYVEAMKKEVAQLRNLVNPNIVKYFSTDVVEVRDTHNDATVDIVLEYVSGGSVRKLLDKFSKLEEKVVGTYTRQVLEGLTYLHMNGIVHRNIKGSNILIDTTGIIKLTDFGCSGRPDRFSEDNVQGAGFLRGAAYWSAPEVVMRKSQGKPADVWGVGCVVLEMLTGLPPWSTTTRSMEEFVHQISLGTPPPFPNDISENCRDFLYKTFKFKPEDRPSPFELLDHPFVREDLQETSYMEAESLQTMNTFGTFTPGKVLDLLQSDNRIGDKKYMDLKTNNFVQKEPTGNLSMSNINIGRLASQATGEYSAHSAQTGLFARLDSKDKAELNRGPSMERDRHFMNKSARTKRLADNPGFVVSEANLQDEASPGATLTGNFRYQYDSIRKSNVEQDDAQTREARRKQLEEELNKDLMRINTGQLSEYGMIEEKSDREENDNEPGTSPELRPEQFKKKIRPVPIQNSLFPDEKIESRGDQGNGYLDNSGEKVQIRTTEKGEFKPFNNFLDVSTTRSVQLKKSPQRETLGDDLRNSENRTMTRKISENLSPSPDPNNEEEIQKQKEKLRKQFEEQMELSLARVDSGKLAQVLDKDQSEPSEFIENRVEGLRKHFEEESSYQIVGMSVDGFRDTWKIGEDQMIDMDKITKKKFEEDLLGGLKGAWESREEGEERESVKGIGSPQITESDGRSPDNKTKRKQMDFVKFSAKGVINEAEEMKEDSFEGEVPYYKPSSKQNI